MDRACSVVSTDADAMAVEQERNSSLTGRKIASDDDDVELVNLKGQSTVRVCTS